MMKSAIILLISSQCNQESYNRVSQRTSDCNEIREHEGQRSAHTLQGTPKQLQHGSMKLSVTRAPVSPQPQITQNGFFCGA